MPNTIDKPTREWVMSRDQGCMAHRLGFAADVPCNGRLVVHHIIIKGMGGTSLPEMNEEQNLITLCDKHHTHAHERDRAGAEQAGIIIRRG
jgi:hypothetical protein